MNFNISCEIFARLAGVSNRMPDNVTSEERAVLRCVRLERKAGHDYAIASNRKIAAIYHLGTSQEPDNLVHVIVDAELVKQCNNEKPFNSSLAITVLPELQIASAKTTLGFNYPGNVAIFPAKTPLDGWRSWVPDKPVTSSVGAMAWNIDDMVALNSASPTGQIAFPQFIDANKPVVVRDISSPDWVGLFMPNRIDDAGKAYTVEPAVLPGWWSV